MKLDIEGTLAIIENVATNASGELAFELAMLREALTRLKRIGELARVAESDAENVVGFTMEEHAEILRLCGVEKP